METIGEQYTLPANGGVSPWPDVRVGPWPDGKVGPWADVRVSPWADGRAVPLGRWSVQVCPSLRNACVDSYRAMVLRPSWEKAYYRCAEAWSKLGDFPQALEVSRSGTAQCDSRTDLDRQLRDIYAGLGERWEGPGRKVGGAWEKGGRSLGERWEGPGRQVGGVGKGKGKGY